MVVQRSSDFIAKVSDKATPLPYITARITTIFYYESFWGPYRR
jgi:hypothetical protein